MGSKEANDDRWKGIISLFEPLEEPNDPYNLNETSFDRFHYLQFLMAAIPIVGFVPAVTGFRLYAEKYPCNEFNLTEIIRKTVVYSLLIQMVSLTLVGAILI